MGTHALLLQKMTTITQPMNLHPDKPNSLSPAKLLVAGQGRKFFWPVNGLALLLGVGQERFARLRNSGMQCGCMFHPDMCSNGFAPVPVAFSFSLTTFSYARCTCRAARSLMRRGTAQYCTVGHSAARYGAVRRGPAYIDENAQVRYI